MEKKIIERLSIYGLKPSDLTEEELNSLKEEIKIEEEGGFLSYAKNRLGVDEATISRLKDVCLE